MRRRRAGKNDVDRLLREALTDDLPRDVEGRLRTAMRPSWRRAVAEASVGEDPGEQTARGEVPSQWGQRPLRAVLGAAALLMLAAGWVVHLEADTGPRAESFLAQQTSARVAAQLHRVSAMTCRLETRDTQGRVRQFTIEWRDTGEAEVRVEGPEGTRQRTIHPRSRIVNVLTAAHEGSLHAMSPPDPPELGPARTHLTPERLASLLAGRWELVRGPSEAEPGVATFSVSGADRWDAVRVTIDSETYLPVSVAQTPSGPESAGSTGVTWTRARLAWPPAPPAPRLLGDHPRSATRPATSWS